MIPLFLRALLPKKNKKSLELGSQRSLSFLSASYEKEYDLEISEHPIRDPQIAQQLIELKECCYEVKESLRIAKEDVFASTDGDDMGFAVAETTNDNETLVNPEIYEIAHEVAERKQSFDEYLIGGTKLKKALENCLIYGDSFLSLEIDLSSRSIVRSLFLPTWEVFRKEDDQGILEGFEQRRYATQTNQQSYNFYPFQTVHFRLDQNFLYGTSLWNTAVRLGVWNYYKESVRNIARACKDLSINPNIYNLSGTNWSHQQKQQYVAKIDSDRKDGRIITDFFELNGEEIRKLGDSNSQIKDLVEAHLQWRYKLIPSGFPTWRYTGLQFQSGAKDISREPARAYSRMRYGWCQLLTKGIKQVIDTEIVLKKGYEFYEKEVLNGNGYRIIWPEWVIDGMEHDDESNVAGIDDLNLEQEETDILNRYTFIGNGNGKIYS